VKQFANVKDFKEFEIVDNCCSDITLDYLKRFSSLAKSWHMLSPVDDSIPIEDKHLKLNIFSVQSGFDHPYLAGLAMGLLFQIFEASGQAFLPEMISCGISIKDKHRIDNAHADFEPTDSEGNPSRYLKIVGLLNSDWEKEWGGGFVFKDMKYYIKPTSFCIFDPSELHKADDILTDKKRFAIDYTVVKNNVRE
tara:strand:+ start:62 stop:643 length:582 start_codon:yes stop_codon:yes gene_type:complete